MSISQKILSCELDIVQEDVLSKVSSDFFDCEHVVAPTCLIPLEISLDHTGLTCVSDGKSKHYSLRKHKWTLVCHELPQNHGAIVTSRSMQKISRQYKNVLVLIRKKPDSRLAKGLKRLSGERLNDTNQITNDGRKSAHVKERDNLDTIETPLQQALSLLMTDGSQLVYIVMVFAREGDCHWWKEAISSQSETFVVNTRWMFPLSLISPRSHQYSHTLFDDISHVNFSCDQPIHLSSCSTSSNFFKIKNTTSQDSNCKALRKKHERLDKKRLAVN